MNRLRAGLFCLALAIMLPACTDAETAKNAAENIGLTEVEVTGFRWFGCSEDDAFRTGFSGIRADGKYVTGVVCSGWFKGATVRFD